MDTALNNSTTINNNSKFGQKFCKFLDSQFYFPALLLFTFIIWYLDPVFGIGTFPLIALIFTIAFSLAFMLLVLKYKNDIMPCIAYCIFMCFTSRYVYVFNFVFLLLIGFLYMHKNKIQYKLNKIIISLILVGIAYCMAGFGSLNGLSSFIDYLMPIVLVFMIALLATAYGAVGKKDFIDYLLKAIMYAGILVSLEIFVYYLFALDFEIMKYIYESKRIYLCRVDYNILRSDNNGLALDYQYSGWGSSNNAGSVLIMTISACLYFTTKGKCGYKYFAPFLMMAVALFLTNSRGAILMLAIAIIPMLLFVVYVSENAKANRIIILAASAIIGIAAVYFSDKVFNLIKTIFSGGVNSSGRDILYPEAWSLFIFSPIFGAGHSQLALGYAHNFVLSILANTGIFGAIMFIYHYFLRGKILIKRPSSPVVFAYFCLLLNDTSGLLDRNFFIPIFVFLSFILIIAVENSCEQSAFKKFVAQTDSLINRPIKGVKAYR